MSEARRGYIQWVHNAKYDPKFSIRRAFEEYVNGFMERAYGISSACPQCEKIEMYALDVWREPDGIRASWKCQACGHVMEKSVPLKNLVDDFNFSRQYSPNRILTFEEFRTYLKMKMAKANIPCHEKPDQTLVGKFGAEYKEMNLEKQKERYNVYLTEIGVEMASV